MRFHLFLSQFLLKDKGHILVRIFSKHFADTTTMMTSDISPIMYQFISIRGANCLWETRASSILEITVQTTLKPSKQASLFSSTKKSTRPPPSTVCRIPDPFEHDQIRKPGVPLL